MNSISENMLIGMEKSAMPDKIWGMMPKFVKKITLKAQKAARFKRRGIALDAERAALGERQQEHNAIGSAMQKKKKEAKKKTVEKLKNAGSMIAAVPVAGAAGVGYGMYKNRNSFDVNRIPE